MPQLQLHMLRVAGVAKIICDNFQKEIDKESVITASLLHDMGNIIKFKLDLFPKGLKPFGLKYWEGVRGEFIKKYGPDEHLATIKISEEIGISQEIINIVNDLEFSMTKQIDRSNNLKKKVIKYSDLRVAPSGVLSLEKRLAEARGRYAIGKTPKWSKEEFNELASIWDKIEKEIFYLTKISPEDITDRGVMRLIPKLREYNIKTK